MVAPKWLGQKIAVPQQDTITIANNWDTADTVTVTINGKSLTATIGTDDTTGGVAIAVKEMINGDTQTGTGDHVFSETGDRVGEFAKLTATVSGDVVTVTGPDDGQSFTMTATESTYDTGTATRAAAVTAESPHDWSDGDNWDTGTAPAAADTVTIENTSVPIKYGLDQNTVTLASLTIKASVQEGFYIGLPDINTDAGSYPHEEYLETHLKIGITNLYIGQGEGSGPARVRLNTGAVKCTMEIYATNTSLDTDLPPIQWLGTHTDNVIRVVSGHLGVGILGESANFETLTVGYQSSQASDSTVEIGDSVTHKAGGTITQAGGTIKSESALIALNQAYGATLYLRGTATATTLDIGGTFYDETSGTITTLNVYPSGVFDKRGNAQAQTISNANAYPGSYWWDPLATVAWSAGIDCHGCSINRAVDDPVLPGIGGDLGRHLTWTPSTI